MKRSMMKFTAKHFAASVGPNSIILAQMGCDEFKGLIVGVQNYCAAPNTTVYAQLCKKGLHVFVEHPTLGFDMEVTANAAGLSEVLKKYHRHAFPFAQ